MSRHSTRATDIDRAFVADEGPEAWETTDAEELRLAETELEAFRRGGRPVTPEEVKAWLAAKRAAPEA